MAICIRLIDYSLQLALPLALLLEGDITFQLIIMNY